MGMFQNFLKFTISSHPDMEVWNKKAKLFAAFLLCIFILTSCNAKVPLSLYEATVSRQAFIFDGVAFGASRKTIVKRRNIQEDDVIFDEDRRLIVKDVVSFPDYEYPTISVYYFYKDKLYAGLYAFLVESQQEQLELLERVVDEYEQASMPYPKASGFYLAYEKIFMGGGRLFSLDWLSPDEGKDKNSMLRIKADRIGEQLFISVYTKSPDGLVYGF